MRFALHGNGGNNSVLALELPRLVTRARELGAHGAALGVRWLAKTTAHGERKSELPKLQARLDRVKVDLNSALTLVARQTQAQKLRKLDSNSAAFEYNALDCAARLTAGSFAELFNDRPLANWASADADDLPQYALMIAMGEVWEISEASTVKKGGGRHAVARNRGDRRVLLRKVFDENGKTIELELGFQAALHDTGGDAANNSGSDRGGSVDEGEVMIRASVCAPMECIALTELTQFRRCALGSDEELSVMRDLHDQEDAAKLCYVIKASPAPIEAGEPTVVLQFAAVEGISAELFELIVYRALSCPDKVGTMNIPTPDGLSVVAMPIPAGTKEQWNFEADDEKLHMHARGLPFLLTAEEEMEVTAIGMADMKLRTPKGKKSAPVGGEDCN